MLVDVVIYKTVHIGKYKIKEVIKMSYSRRTVTDGVTVMNKDLYDNLQDGIDEALKALPITQHEMIWKAYIAWIKEINIPMP